MRLVDTVVFSQRSLSRAPLRTVMMLLATAIGVAAVVLLTSLGEGGRRYVSGQFASLGTNLLIVVPGRSETSGGGPGALMMGETPRDLTLDDALAVSRLGRVEKAAPVIVGTGTVNANGLSRDMMVLGSTADMLSVRGWEVALGEFLPPLEMDRAASVCVIGRILREDFFPNSNPLGEWIRIGDRRFRVIGVMADTGTAGGINVDDSVIVPVASAQALFNTAGLFRILVEVSTSEGLGPARLAIEDLLAERHGERDVTVITQDALVATFDSIFGAITLALGGIAAISLLVAGVLIMNVMLVAVSQRTTEIGLMKAIGGRQGQILRLFLTEAILLSLGGAAIGLGLGMAGVTGLNQGFPDVDFAPPIWAVAAALGTAVASGLIFGLLPARRAARLDPINALSGR